MNQTVSSLRTGNRPAPGATSAIPAFLEPSEPALRDGWNNPMTEAASPLFGLAIHLSTVDQHPDVPQLYDDVSHQIRAILQYIRQYDYDDASFTAYSYSLCLFMDEIVMERPWGVHSKWSEKSLLSEFHQETWGGEKFFTLMERMSDEAAKYHHALEVMYLCICLGLKGKYAVHENTDVEINKVITRLHRPIRQLRGPLPERLSDPLQHVAPRNYRLSRQWPWWSPWLIAGLLLVAIYSFYSWRLTRITAQVLKSLEPLLTL